MQQFIWKANHKGILQELRKPYDTQETNFLLALGNVKNAGKARIRREWTETEKGLLLTVSLQNNTASRMELPDLCFEIEANCRYVKDQQITYRQRVMQHACICGHSSFIYWCRPSGEGDSLALLPLGDTALVEERNDTPYCVQAAPLTLAPGQTHAYAFLLCWMENHWAIQEKLYENDLMALDIFPGLTIPKGLKLLLRPRSHLGIRGVVCDAASVTEESEGIYAVAFHATGEQEVHIIDGQGHHCLVRCYATLPIEELISLRAKHIFEKQRYTGSEWYDGVFSSWCMENHRMTLPGDTMGMYEYAVCADDPGLCKAPYLAEKNVVRPDADEIAAIEYYIEHFVWGGLQRTDQETPYPYGIYGSDNWMKNRNSPFGLGSGGLGQERMWRSFDYTHLIQLYYNMYLIAKQYPQYTQYLDAEGYLDRAIHTALAFFEVPYQIFMRKPWDFRGYCDWAFKQGNFHEKYILPLLEAKENEQLRSYWEAKAKYMIYDNPLPYGSEMWFDSTAFESTQAVAHYAVEHGLPADDGWYDKNLFGPGEGGYRKHTQIDPEKAEWFLKAQMGANLACRGSQQRCYWQLGSDFRAGGYKEYLLSYMSQMGGAAILDYALYFDEHPQENLRTAYASLLAPWCLVNLGEGDPFYPHHENLGAAGWAFLPEEGGSYWQMMRHRPRGPWNLDGEIDNGLSAGICAATSVLAFDEVFGLVCYGAAWEETPQSIVVFPQDGVRRSIHFLHNLPQRTHLSLSRDAIVQAEISKTENRVQLLCENITGDAHSLIVTLNGRAHCLSVPAQPRYQMMILNMEEVQCN